MCDMLPLSVATVPHHGSQAIRRRSLLQLRSANKSSLDFMSVAGRGDQCNLWRVCYTMKFKHNELQLKGGPPARLPGVLQRCVRARALKGLLTADSLPAVRTRLVLSQTLAFYSRFQDPARCRCYCR